MIILGKSNIVRVSYYQEEEHKGKEECEPNGKRPGCNVSRSRIKAERGNSMNEEQKKI